MHAQKKTKIVATIGPKSEDKAVLRKMMQAGMNVARLNFSHGDHAEHKRVIGAVRELAEELALSIAILADLQGPRIRVILKEEREFQVGDTLTLTDKSHALAERDITLDHERLIKEMEVGHRVLIEDGRYEFTVTQKHADSVVVTAESNGTLKQHKGVILPDTNLFLSVLSEKDADDLAFAVAEGVDYIGLSFVGSAQDVEEVRTIVNHSVEDIDARPELVAKVERKVAIQNLKEIIRAADAVMVARGDLGVEMPTSEVVLLQKQIIAESLANAKPVIVATQMLQSMTNNPRPTRAEVSDVSNAVIDHADALMLSEETAAGEYPVESVAMMAEIIEKTEHSPFDDLYKTLELNFKSDYATMVRSVYTLAKSFGTRAILVTTLRGYTAKLISHFRPDQSIFVATPSQPIYQKMALIWGIEPYYLPNITNFDDLPEALLAAAKEKGEVARGDKVAVLLGRDYLESDMRLVGIQEVK